jgi:hypothetical protein
LLFIPPKKYVTLQKSLVFTFDALDRHATRKISFKQEYFSQSSQIASFQSFCDFYRPKRLKLENVRNFLSYENSVVLKPTLRSLLKLGYQVMINKTPSRESTCAKETSQSVEYE